MALLWKVTDSASQTEVCAHEFNRGPVPMCWTSDQSSDKQKTWGVKMQYTETQNKSDRNWCWREARRTKYFGNDCLDYYFNIAS